MAQREEEARAARVVDDEAASDEDLAAAMRTEPDAFVELYERYRHRVYAYALARVNSGDDAADLTQQVFLRAFDSLRAGRTYRTTFASWLFTVAHNATVDFYRRRRPTLSWSLVPAPMEPLDDLDLDHALTHGEDLARLRQILETLSVEQRELLALRFAAGLTAREIGPVVGLSPAAVQKQIRRTLQRMKERYHEDHER